MSSHMTEKQLRSITTLGGLRRAGITVDSVKEEMRRNLIAKLHAGERLFAGIIGYDDTVVPAIVNAVLARHDMLLLGLRGQAKTRIVRMLPTLLDPWVPIVRNSEVNDNPFAPISKHGMDLVAECGDDTEIEWIPAEQRYAEKLATPDVTIADLIGDIDPIKAAAQRLHYAHEGAIHFGLIPRTNRGVFAINELPDLQPRIQVGLFNIMQEKDIQIRGFNVRIPLDVMMVFTANPEDYTNRGSIITPLKDRIDSQILTHYPERLDDAVAITAQEAWIERDGRRVVLPRFFRDIVEHIAFEARESEFVDQRSGVSARLTISALENLVSNAERRALMHGDDVVAPRVSDLLRLLPAMTGKMELVYEGEQEGPVKVSKLLIGKAVRAVFGGMFPEPGAKKGARGSRGERSRGEEALHAARADESAPSVYAELIAWFDHGGRVELRDDMPFADYAAALHAVPGLAELVRTHIADVAADEHALAAAMEFVIDGLHQHSRLARHEGHGAIAYRDMLGTLFTMSAPDEDEEL